uniref:Uncharacterized protein n=1 Tax=Cyprinus carpio TaxID=7962 RepID=A0A8C2IBG3_CYPCA
MESVLKKSLLAPVKMLKICMSEEKQWSKGASERPGQRAGPERRTRVCCHPIRPTWRERGKTLRALIRDHFRRKYQLTKVHTHQNFTFDLTSFTFEGISFRLI